MAVLKVEIPEEIKSEFRAMPAVELSIFVSRVLKEELSRLIRFKEIVSKSKLREGQAKELADKISKSLAERYDKLLAGG